MRETKPFDLDERGDCDGNDGQRLADADSLEDGEAVGFAREFAGEGDEQFVVDGEEEADGEVQEERHRGGGDLEVGADVAVERGALVEKEGGHLRVDDPEHDVGEPDGEDAYQHLHFLHLRHGTQLPWIVHPLCLSTLVEYWRGRSIQKPAIQ